MATALPIPHYWLDPNNVDTMTAIIAMGIIRLMPAARDTVATNRRQFLATLHERLAAWTDNWRPTAVRP